MAPLGQGAQAAVWRAYDERLDREVALKLLSEGALGLATGTWLQEAQAMSRLAHPHILPVFEADQIEGQAFLVLELVSGTNLAQALRQRRVWPAREAVDLMVGVVDALRAAHAQGVVHRDLKPSNILMGDDGRARVMDFGIAARLSATPGAATTAGAEIVGSAGYLSPEAAAGLSPSAQMDVFSAGLILGELLSGQPLRAQRDPARALHSALHEDLKLGTQVEVDDRLRGIVQRAIARDPALRFDTATSMRDALMQWLLPLDEATKDAPSGQGTLDFLLRRMRLKSDFPAMSERVLRIQRMANSDSENLNHLADEILQDVALTQKLLRLVNTAQYRRMGHGVSTVSRAVALVGLAGIRNLTLSLVLLEHMANKAHAIRLKEGFLKSLLAGQLAHALARNSAEAEEGFLGAMLYNLGQLLTEYYFPDEAEAIRTQVRLNTSLRTHPDVAADQAATMVLGLSFEALGMGVARHWGLPEALQRCMVRPQSQPPNHRVAAGPEHQRWLAIMTNELADALWQTDDPAQAARIELIAVRHGRALGLDGSELQAAVDQARRGLAQAAQAMGLSLKHGAQGHHLLAVPPDNGATATMAPTDATLPALGLAEGEATAVVELAPSQTAPVAAQGLLVAGIQDITDTLAGDGFRLSQLLRMVLETMYRALGFQRVVFCLRDPATGRLVGRFGLGERAAQLSPLFTLALQWPAGQTPDLMGAVCLKGSDTLILDSRQANIAQRLPGWYRQHVDAPTFLLLPMMNKGVPFALIYADHAQPGQWNANDAELALLRTLRNQAVMAFKQSRQSL
jgi:serine/threonine protein kinase